MSKKFSRPIVNLITAFLIVLVTIGTTVPSPAKAESAGPLYPDTGANVSGIGTVSWLNTLNLVSDNNSTASVNLPRSQISNYLHATDFDFNIPTNAVINGIEVTVGRAALFGYIKDYAVQLVSGNQVIGDNKAITDLDWPIKEFGQPYGTVDDTWGTALTPSEINSSGFGVSLAVINTDPNSSSTSIRTAAVDYISVTVSYSIPTATELFQTETSVQYGGTANLSASMVPAVEGLNVDFTIDGEPACSATTSASGVADCTSPVILKNAGTHTGSIRASFTGNAIYAASSTVGDLNVDPLPIQVSANAITKTFGEVDPKLTYDSFPELVGDDHFSGTLERLSGSDVGTYPISQGSLTAGGNYTITYDGADFKIDPLVIHVTANPAGKIYGEPDPDLSFTSLPALVGNDELTGELDREDGDTAGTYAILQGDLEASTNYVIDFTSADFNIHPLEITVTAHPISKTYGEDDPVLTYTVSPKLIGNDSLTGTLERDAGEDAGLYSIQTGTLEADTNYTIVDFVGAEFEILKADQQITVTKHAPAYAYVESTFTVAADSSSGLDVEYSASGSCTNVGPSFTIISDDEDCTVHYNQPGDQNLNAAAEISETVETGTAEGPVITLQPESVTLNQQGQSAVFTAAADGDPAPDVIWQVSIDGGVNFTDIPGEVSTTLTISSPPTTFDGYMYRAVFSNSEGTAVSSAATLDLRYYWIWLPFINR